MKKEDLKLIPHITYEEGKFVHLHVVEGYILTEWTEDQPVIEYYGTECIYAPITEKYPEYRTITVEQHQELEAARQAAEEEEMKKREEEYENSRN